MIERRVMIVPIGLEKDRVIEGAKQYPINAIYLLHNPIQNLEEQDKGVVFYSELFASQAKSEIKETLIEVHEDIAQLNNFSSSIQVLNKIFHFEKDTKNFNHIYINISTASKAFALAAYVFASMHSRITTIFYLSTLNYILLDHLQKNSDISELKDQFIKKGLTVGPYSVEEIPVFKLENFTDEEIFVLKAVGKRKKIESLKILIQQILKFEYSPAIRIKIKRILENFEEKGLIHFQKERRELVIIIDDKLRKYSEIYS